MPFIFLLESDSSAVDLFLKSAKVSPSSLDRRSQRAGIAKAKEPGITSPTSSEIQQDKGEGPRCIA